MRLARFYPVVAVLVSSIASATAVAADGVFIRFQMIEPKDTKYFVQLKGYIHKSPWYLPQAVVPEGADKDAERRLAAGQATDWFDLGGHAGPLLHGRLNRSGGVAEFPNVTADFRCDGEHEQRTVVIELATAPQADAVVRRWRESFRGSLTSVLVSPNLARDGAELESAAEMTERRLQWARQATGGKRVSPRSLIVQTSFWSPQREELNLKEAEVLHLLGFNVVGNQRPEVKERFDLRGPGHTHGVKFGPAATRAEIDELMKTHAARYTEPLDPGVPFGFADEICARPPIGDDQQALAHFHAWLAQQHVMPRELGVGKLTDVVPIETPVVLREREAADGPAARRVFYYTSRFRQHAATERVRWHTEALHRYFPKSVSRDSPRRPSETIGPGFSAANLVPRLRLGTHYTRDAASQGPALPGGSLAVRGELVSEFVEAEPRVSEFPGGAWERGRAGVLTSTLVADHPYFSGTGLGMGMSPNPTWGNYPLAADWFDLARRHAVDLAGIEDWMGLQYMYGPNTTWEGFQLMGFQASIFRSGSRGRLPIIAWITPSDETNLRLKSGSALCQGAKNFFYWTYGPTCTSTENYWSDLRGAYDGVARVTRQLAAAEHIIAPGKTRRTRVALLYSISSDLWQPFGYVHMLERRGTYLALVHDQYLVDMLTEEDIAAGRLNDYDVLYATDPCIKTIAAERIVDWVRRGGHLYGSTAAGSRNEFNEPAAGLSEAFGIAADVPVQVQPGRYHIRGALNSMQYLDEVNWLVDESLPGFETFGVMGVKASVTPAGGDVAAVYRDGSPAVVRQAFGRGSSIWMGTCPAIAYIKQARFVPAELKEKWPAGHRRIVVQAARSAKAPRLVELSHPVVEAGVYDSPAGTAIVLANFTYEPIDKLHVRVTVPQRPKSVRSIVKGAIAYSADTNPGTIGEAVVEFTMPLGLTDIVLVE